MAVSTTWRRRVQSTGGCGSCITKAIVRNSHRQNRRCEPLQEAAEGVLGDLELHDAGGRQHGIRQSVIRSHCILDPTFLQKGNSKWGWVWVAGKATHRLVVGR